MSNERDNLIDIIEQYKELVKRQAEEIAHLDERLAKLAEENEHLRTQLALNEIPPINTPVPVYPPPITVPVPPNYKGWWEYPTPYCLCIDGACCNVTL